MTCDAIDAELAKRTALIAKMADDVRQLHAEIEMLSRQQRSLRGTMGVPSSSSPPNLEERFRNLPAQDTKGASISIDPATAAQFGFGSEAAAMDTATDVLNPASTLATFCATVSELLESRSGVFAVVCELVGAVTPEERTTAAVLWVAERATLFPAMQAHAAACTLRAHELAQKQQPTMIDSTTMPEIFRGFPMVKRLSILAATLTMFELKALAQPERQVAAARRGVHFARTPHLTLHRRPSPPARRSRSALSSASLRGA